MVNIHINIYHVTCLLNEQESVAYCFCVFYQNAIYLCFILWKYLPWYCCILFVFVSAVHVFMFMLFDPCPNVESFYVLNGCMRKFIWSTFYKTIDEDVLRDSILALHACIDLTSVSVFRGSELNLRAKSVCW